MILGLILVGIPSQAENSSTHRFRYGEFNPVDTAEYLRQFHSEPERVMNTPLAKIDENGQIVKSQVSPLEKLGSFDEMLEARDAARAEICRHTNRSCDRRAGWRAGYDQQNQISAFMWDAVDLVRRPVDMEARGLLRFSLPEPPWSDSFWPTTRGLTGRRWHDKGFPNSSNWEENYGHYQMFPPWVISADSLSPSEKYDILVGDSSFRLTESQWASGRRAMERSGRVPGWAGLCHGWAPAAIMAPNPQKTVNVQAPNGRMVTFYPSDIKALASLSWGEAPPLMRFAGTRCKRNNPKEDEIGRVDDPTCFDVNPGVWHMAIVNQMAVKKRSFVFDATYDLQVWNYPIAAYQYQYFNPQTLAVSTKLAGSTIRLQDYHLDKFRKYRSPDAKYVVGIAMDVQYSVPTQPSTKAVNKPLFHVVKYVYDLELDASGTIIGGEWYSNFHPDFIWNPPTNGKALSSWEKSLPAPIVWDGTGPVPPELRAGALEASRKEQPLSAVVETLLRLSRPEPAPAPAPETETP